MAAAHHAAESVDADPEWWKGHWYRGPVCKKWCEKMAAHAIDAMSLSCVCSWRVGLTGRLRAGPEQAAVPGDGGERLEQAIASLKGAARRPRSQRNKQKEVDIALKAAKDASPHAARANQQRGEVRAPTGHLRERVHVVATRGVLAVVDRPRNPVRRHLGLPGGLRQ